MHALPCPAPPCPALPCPLYRRQSQPCQPTYVYISCFVLLCPHPEQGCTCHDQQEHQAEAFCVVNSSVFSLSHRILTLQSICMLLQPFKRSRASDAADHELRPAVTMQPWPQSLQQFVTSNNLSAQSASLQTLQNQAKQAQASLEANQQRASQWAQDAGNKQRSPFEQRRPTGFVARLGSQDRTNRTQAEAPGLLCQQQHALKHVSGCSPRESNYSGVGWDPQLMWSSSASMEQGSISRDPRLDVSCRSRGLKRLCSTQCTQCVSTAPFNLCLPFAARNPEMSTGTF